MRPSTEEELAEIVRGAAGPLRIRGGGTRDRAHRRRAARDGGTGGRAALRARGAHAGGGGGQPARGDRGDARGRRPAAALRGAGPAGAPRTGGRLDAGGRGGGQWLGAAAHPDGGLPRQSDRRALRRWRGAGGEERRAGDEECHRLRSGEADGGQPRHAGRAERGGLQASAAARDGADPGPAGPRAGAGGGGDGRGARIALRCVGRGALAGAGDLPADRGVRGLGALPCGEAPSAAHGLRRGGRSGEPLGGDPRCGALPRPGRATSGGSR